jgi:short-subunit dehydrogenase
MGRDLTGCRAIVTGASSGIGRAVAAELATAGCRVVLAARSADRLEAAARGLAGARAVPCDVTVPADRERLVRTAVGFWGGLDLLVNNAGVASWGHFATSTEEINRRVMETNFFAPVELTRLCVPHLMNGNRPAVVNVTSMCGRRGMPAWPEYSASKFALVGISEAWRAEFARFGIDVVTIVPGLTKTELTSHMLRSDGRADIRHDEGMDPADVAKAIVRAVRRGSTEVVLGSEAKWMLRMNRFAPRLLNKLIARKIKKLYAKG